MSDAPTPIEAAEAEAFAITGPGAYLARNGERMYVREIVSGLCLGGRYGDYIIGIAWRLDGTRGAPGIETPYDLVARASSPQTKEGET